MDDNLFFQKFCKAINIEFGKDYIVRYKSALSDPDCLTLNELEACLILLKNQLPNNKILFLPDSIEIQEYNLEFLKDLNKQIEELIKEKEGD